MSRVADKNGERSAEEKEVLYVHSQTGLPRAQSVGHSSAQQVLFN